MTNAVFSPKTAASTTAAAPLTVEWPDGYSGCAGVGISGVQVGSEARIAVIGRQKTYWYFASQHAMAASAIATFSSAIRRAFSESVVLRAAASRSATPFQK